MTLVQAVKNGADYLDVNFPNWATYIDLNILDMRFTDKCIAGQLNDKHPSSNILGDMNINFGFYLTEEYGEVDSPQREESWYRLNNLWEQAVKERQLLRS